MYHINLTNRTVSLFVFLLMIISQFIYAQSQHPQLKDITIQAGIRFTHSFGDDKMSNLVESSGVGCAFLDYDQDNDLDIYLVNGAYLEGLSHVRGRKNKGKLLNCLYKNNGDGTFTDVTKQAGVGHEGMGMAVVSADVDNDGDQDIFVSNYGPNVFYLNNGDGTFTENTEKAGLVNDKFGIGATFLDYNLDGNLDLYLGNYIEFDPEYKYFYAADNFPGPLAYQGQQDVLYHNNGDGTFTDMTKQAGLLNQAGRAMGVSSGDIDNDGAWDIFIANDAMVNYMYRNNGDGTFTDIAVRSGAGFGQYGNATSAMSGEFGDIDLDGFVDIVVPDMAYSCIYKNTGSGFFEEMSAAMGLAPICGQYTSWSCNISDFDNDGIEDLFISNGSPHRLVKEEDLLLLNDSGERYTNISNEVGPDFQDKFVSRGSCTGDFDNDGDQDLLIQNLNDRPRLLLNNRGNKHNWLLINLIGTKSNRDAIGSRINLKANQIVQTRWKRSNSGYLSQGDFRIHFGLGKAAKVDQIEIHWPSGNIQTLKNIDVNQILTIEESISKR